MYKAFQGYGGKAFGRKSYRLSLTGHNLEIMVRVKKLLEWHVHMKTY